METSVQIRPGALLRTIESPDGELFAVPEMEVKLADGTEGDDTTYQLEQHGEETGVGNSRRIREP